MAHSRYASSPKTGAPARRSVAKDTSQLLKAGSAFLGAGLLLVLLMVTVFGGISAHGPHTDAGWISLVFALGCLPLGLLLLLLGGAKWLGSGRQ